MNNKVDEQAYGGWDEKYKSQSENCAAWSDEPQPFVLKTIKALMSSSNIIDLGAGDGRNTQILIESGHKVAALDISPRALAQLQENLTSLGLEPSALVLGNLEQLPLAAKQYDAALAADVLPQVANVCKALKEIHRILKPGGRLFVNVFTPKDCAFGEGEEIAPKQFAYKGTLFSFFEPGDMQRMTEGLFTIVEEEAVSWWDPPHTPFRPYRHKHEALFYVMEKQ